MPDGSSGCINYCKAPADSCPVQFLDFCKDPKGYYPIATGFTVKLCGIAMLISNRHVLNEALSGARLFVRARLKTGEPIRLYVAETHGHPDPNVDLAACRLKIPRNIKEEDIDIGFIAEDAYRKQGRSTLAALDYVRAGDEAVFAGFPLVIGGVRALVADRETPLVRSGIVSIVLPGDTRFGDKTTHDIFLVDSWAFQGNSGSPVVIPPVLMTYNNDKRERNSAKLVGVVSAFLDLNAPIEHAVVVGGVRAKVNSGLAIIQSIDGIEDIAQQFEGAECIPIEKNSEGGSAVKPNAEEANKSIQ
jgi:hypothetical protein